MFSVMEQFFRTYQYTIAALTAFGTVGAVIVSLVVAFMSRNVRKTRLTAWASMRTIIGPGLDPNNSPRYLAVNVTNTGIMPLRIPFSFCNWRVSSKSEFYTAVPYDGTASDPLIPRRTYPVEIAPRTSQTFFVSTADGFLEEMRMIALRDGLTRRQISGMRMLVVTEDTVFCKVEVAKGVYEELLKAVET